MNIINIIVFSKDLIHRKKIWLTYFCHMPMKLTFRRQRLENQFKIILCYIVTLRPAWAR